MLEEELFLLKLLNYNPVSDREEVNSTFKCSFKLNSDKKKSFLIFIEPEHTYYLFSREMVIKLFELVDKLSVKDILIYLNKKHKDYVALLKSFLIIGFTYRKEANDNLVQSTSYRVLYKSSQ